MPTSTFSARSTPPAPAAVRPMQGAESSLPASRPPARSGLHLPLPRVARPWAFGAEAGGSTSSTGLHLRLPLRSSGGRRTGADSHAEAVRPRGTVARAGSSAEQHQPKRARLRDPSPSAADGARGPAASGEVAPVPAVASARARFQATLAEARQRQPVQAAKGWEEVVCRLCRTGRDSAICESSVALLEAVARVPAAAQVPLAVCAHELCEGFGRRTSERLQVLSMLADLVEHGGTEELEEVLACLRLLAGAARRRKVLRAVHGGVPAASRRHFLRMAEVLLRAGHDADVAAVCEAAGRCREMVRPRGSSWAERHRRPVAPSRGGPTAAVAPPFTDEDRAILEALQQQVYDEFDEANEARYEERYAVQLAARRRRQGGDESDHDSDVASDVDSELDRPSDPDPTSDGQAAPAADLEAEAAETLRLVQRSHTENVQDQERICMVKDAWAYLGRRYRRELPEGAMFLLVKGAYDATVREARRGQGPYAADALPHLEKEWPNSATSARQAELLAEQAPLPAHQALTIVFEGQQDGHMAAIVDDDVMAHYLDEEGLGARGFVAILWSIIHRRGEGAALGSPQGVRAARERDNLRHALWGAILDNVLVKVLTHGQRRPKRLCHNGLAQRLLSKLEGYEPFTVTPTRPQQLLTQLSKTFAEEVEAAWGEDEPPTTLVAAFVARARTLSRQAFGEVDRATFEDDLAEYVRITYAQSAAEALGG